MWCARQYDFSGGRRLSAGVRVPGNMTSVVVVVCLLVWCARQYDFSGGRRLSANVPGGMNRAVVFV